MWWNRKHAVCAECGVVYKVGTGFNNKCKACGKGDKERWERQVAVSLWASANWEKLEPQMIEDKKKQQESYNGLYNACSNATSYNQMAAAYAQVGPQNRCGNIMGGLGNI